MCAFAKFAVEAVTIQQREPDLEVFFLAVMWCSGHQQEVTGDGAEEFTQQEAFGLVDLAAEVVGGELVGLVNDDQVPLGVFELLLVLFVARQLIQSADELVLFIEVVAGGALLLLLAAKDLELNTELFQQLVLPLLGKGTR